MGDHHLTAWVGPARALGSALAGGAAGLVRRLPPLLLLIVAAAISLALVTSFHGGRPSPILAVGGLGGLSLARLPLGILIGGWAALVLELVVAWRQRLPSGGIAAALLLGVIACLALEATGAVPIALLLAFMSAFVWARWQRLAGPILPVRSLGRQAALTLCVLLAGAAVLSSQRIGAAPAALTGMLLVGGLGGVAGLLPLSSWVGAASRVSPAEAAVWRVWLVPVAVVSLARFLVAQPGVLAEVMQLLLVGLGLATAIFWGCAAFRADPPTRYLRVFQADVGFMCVGVGSGDVKGLAAAVLLIVVHWLSGAVLSQPSGSRAHLLGWVGLSGVPPFGGFTGRLLVVVGVSFMGPVVVGLALLALGLQLAACGAGLGETLRSGADRGPRLRELAGLGAGLAVLVLGLVVDPFLHLAFGVRL